MSRLLWPLLLLIALLASSARAQTFGPPVRSERVLTLLDREGNIRFTFGSYYSQWQNPFQIHVTTSSPTYGDVSRTVRLLADTPPSPLFEGTYALRRHWSVGIWYNPIRGEQVRGRVAVKDVDVTLNYGRDTDLADFHVIYSAPHGLSAQLGYYRESGTFRNLKVSVLPPVHYAQGSWNIWLTQRLDAFTRNGWVIDRLTAQLVPFIAAGYHASSSLHHAASLQLGLGITFRDRLSLSSSVWWFDLGSPITATRLTGGLAYRY